MQATYRPGPNLQFCTLGVLHHVTPSSVKTQRRLPHCCDIANTATDDHNPTQAALRGNGGGRSRQSRFRSRPSRPAATDRPPRRGRVIGPAPAARRRKRRRRCPAMLRSKSAAPSGVARCGVRDGEARLFQFAAIGGRRWEIPRVDPVCVEPAAGEDRAQRNDDRGSVVVTAHLADKAAPRPESPADAREDGFWRPHPMQCCV